MIIIFNIDAIKSDLKHIQQENKILIVYIDPDINKLWVRFPKIKDLNLKIIKPKKAEQIISQAINKRWNPKEKG